jgi:sulfur-carrier protein adenylyltransferase/sulfurtransferase
MDRRYTILAILLILLAFGIWILPENGRTKETNPRELLTSVDDPARFLSTDLITERIIGADPSLQLIDVRPAMDFRKYALQGAVNIPLDSLLSPQWKDVLTQPGKDKVFYSNGDIEADQAWQICKRISVQRIFVMKGGLNQWYSTIMKCSPPAATAPSQAIDLYNFRLAARQYFVGGSAGLNASPADSQKGSADKGENVKVIKKEAKKSSGGGC